MSEQISEIRDAQRFLQLAEAAEQVAIGWRERAAAILRTKPVERQAEPPASPASDEPDDLPYTPDHRDPKPRTGNRKHANITAVVTLCRRKQGATGEEVMVAAGWPRPPYPSAMLAMAMRNNLKMEVIDKPDGRRYRFVAA